MYSNFRFIEDGIRTYVTESVNAEGIVKPMEYKKELSAALEAKTANPRTTGVVINQLYKNVILSARNLDFGDVPASKGNVLNIKKWNITEQSIAILNNAMDSETEELKALNALHDFLVNARADFEYGYKYNIEMLTTMYCVMVYCLYDLIDNNITILTYTSTNTRQKAMRHNYSYNAAVQFVQLYKSGEWGKMVKAMKDPKVASKATESFKLQCNGKPAKEAALGTTGITVAALQAGAETMLGYIALPVGVLGATVLALYSLRGLIHYLFIGSAHFAAFLKNQATLIDESVKTDKTLNKFQTTVITGVSNVMQSIAGFLNTKVLRIEKETKKKIDSENKKMQKALKNPESAEAKMPKSSMDTTDDGADMPVAIL